MAAPTLVLRGGRDPIAPRRWVEELAAILPHGEAGEIPGAAHATTFSAPGPLAAAVRRWVAVNPSAVPVSGRLRAVGA